MVLCFQLSLPCTLFVLAEMFLLSWFCSVSSSLFSFPPALAVLSSLSHCASAVQLRSLQLTMINRGKVYQVVSLEGDMICCFFSRGPMRSLEKRWVEGIAISPSVLCPQMLPVVLLFGAVSLLASGCCVFRYVLSAQSLCGLEIPI